MYFIKLIKNTILFYKNNGLISLLKITTTFFKKTLSIPSFIYKQKQIKNISLLNIGELVDFSFKDSYGLVKPIQIKYELKKFLKFIINQNVKSILEIGTANGGTLFLFSKILKNNSTIISIDLPGGEYGGGYPFYKVPLYKSFINDNQRLFLIRANSQNINTLKRVKKYLNGEKIDLLFIDADHSYNGVKNDFEIYRNLVKDGGIIAFHDIVKHKDRINSEVDIFWNEIKKQYEHIEFVRNWDQGWGGIGVLINNK